MTYSWKFNFFVLAFILSSFMLVPILNETADTSLLVYGDVLKQGVYVFLTNHRTIIISFCLISICAYVSILFLRITNFENPEIASEYYESILDHVSLGFSGSSIFLFILSATAVSFGKLSILLFAILILLLIIYNTSKKNRIPRLRNHNILDYTAIGMVPFVGVFLTILLVKYGYVYELELPLNIDSVNHAYYTAQIVLDNNLQALPYYHYGFHYICVFISSLTGENIPKTILIFGQTLQTVIPFVVYFPVHIITNNSKVALFCVVIAGLGFSMPSISTSWGKYPALLAILSFCYVLYIVLKVFEKTRVSPSHLMFAICMILVSILIHTRMLILIASVLLALLIDKMNPIDEKPKGIFMGVVLIVFLISLLNETISNTVLGIAMQPYKENIIFFGLLIVMIPFSSLYFGRDTFQIGLVFTVLLLF